MTLKYNSITSITLFIFGLAIFLILQAIAYEKMEGHGILADAYMHRLQRNATLQQISFFVLVFCWAASNLISISNFNEYKTSIIKILIVVQTILTVLSIFFLLLLMTTGGFM